MGIATEPKRRNPGKSLHFSSGDRSSQSQAEPSADSARTGKTGPAWGKRILVVALLAAGAVLLVAASLALVSSEKSTDQPLIYYTARRTDLPITVTERGSLESQRNLEVNCEVDDVSGDGLDGTTILWIVPNGSSVNKGDLLVELDVAMHQDRLDAQVLDYEQAVAEQIQAEAKFENQKTQNETMEAEAALQVELARLDLQMFQDKRRGTYTLEVEEINRSIDDVRNQILAAQASMELSSNEKEGIEALFKLGYAGKSELDRVRLDYLQAESTLAAQLNRLVTYQSELKKKQTYEKQMQELQLQGALETAKRNLDQVKLNSKSLYAQAEAACIAANETLKKEKERLERYREAVKKCRIFAPDDGMVAYATSGNHWNREEIREGVQVRPKQTILTLPDLKHMQIKTSVHESVLDQITTGLPVKVRVDAFPHREYRGSVKSVAVLPDQSGWLSSNAKVYQTYVTIDEEVDQLKPGMTAVAEIDVDQLTDVISLPVQAVVQGHGECWCYVANDGDVERRTLELGISNDKFVEITSGLNEGERVVLNPTAIIDESQKSGSQATPDPKPNENDGDASSDTTDRVPIPRPPPTDD